MGAGVTTSDPRKARFLTGPGLIRLLNDGQLGLRVTVKALVKGVRADEIYCRKMGSDLFSELIG